MATERETERDEELQHLLELRDATQDRVRELELQERRYGFACPPHIRTELAKGRAELIELTKKIAPPAAPQYLDRMSADEQRKYLIALVMTLQADFVSCHTRLNRRVWLMCAVLAASNMLLALVMAAVAWGFL